jgi:hypothetical protein
VSQQETTPAVPFRNGSVAVARGDDAQIIGVEVRVLVLYADIAGLPAPLAERARVVLAEAEKGKDPSRVGNPRLTH